MKTLGTILISALALATPLVPITATSAAADPGSPGCVTKVEFGKAAKGMPKAKVDRIFGTHGRTGKRGIVSYSGCPTFSIVIVKYVRSNGALRVASKSAVWGG